MYYSMYNIDIYYMIIYVLYKLSPSPDKKLDQNIQTASFLTHTKSLCQVNPLNRLLLKPRMNTQQGWNLYLPNLYIIDILFEL